MMSLNPFIIFTRKNPPQPLDLNTLLSDIKKMIGSSDAVISLEKKIETVPRFPNLLIATDYYELALENDREKMDDLCKQHKITFEQIEGYILLFKDKYIAYQFIKKYEFHDKGVDSFPNGKIGIRFTMQDLQQIALKINSKDFKHLPLMMKK